MSSLSPNLRNGHHVVALPPQPTACAGLFVACWMSGLTAASAQSATLAAPDDRCRIIHGDCLDVMRSLDDGQFDLIITSPPYNIRNTESSILKNGHKKPSSNRGNSWKWGNNKLAGGGYADHPDDMPHGMYVEWQRRCLKEMWRLLSERGAIFYNHKWRIKSGILDQRCDITSVLPLRQIIIWQRNGGINFNYTYYLPKCEVIYVFAKPQWRIKKNKIGVGDVWHIAQERNNGHPAPFPVELPARIIETTERVERVLDPFCGSGTTGVAAIDAGCGFVGIDNSMEYVETARRRIGKIRERLL